jgi:hypothetical protein
LIAQKESKLQEVEVDLSHARYWAYYTSENEKEKKMAGLLLKLLVSFAAFFPPANAFSSTRSRQIHNISPTFASRSKFEPLFVVKEPKESFSTVQNDSVDSPTSVDDVLDDSLSEEIICARGVCVIPDDDDVMALEVSNDESIADKVLNSYLGPRALLAGASILYGTNFPLGVIMNENLNPSAGTGARMLMASIALSPFLLKLDPKLSKSAFLCGCFTALGYTTQSLALVDTSPATVAFLGCATVLVCPTLEALVNKKPMGLKDAPQIWLAATLCIAGVGVLELYDPTGAGLDTGWGDVLSILQAVGFGTSFFLTERMMRGQPEQALPITAVQVSVSALVCFVWCLADGWIGQPGSESLGIPFMFLDPSMRMAAGAVAFTGLITTALNRFVETSGKRTEPVYLPLHKHQVFAYHFCVCYYPLVIDSSW